MSDQKLTKTQRREQAREQARVAREAEKKREKRNRLLLQGGVLVGVLAILGIVALVLTQTMKPAGPGPANMASGGVVLTQDLAVEATPALQDGEKRVAPEVNRDELPLDITVYVDYSCVHCSQFEVTNGDLLETWVGSGDATLQIYPVNILDTSSKYSTRAANLISCIVNQDPADGVVFNVHANLLSGEVWSKVSEQGGLSNDELIEQAELGGATINDELRQCVKDVQFGDFVDKTTKAITTQDGTGVLGLADGVQLTASNGLQSADGPQLLNGTPLVIVNGVQWITTQPADYSDFEEYVLKVKAEVEAKSTKSTKSSNGSATGETAETE